MATKQLLPDTEEDIFNPYHLRPLASLNRRQLIDLPGIDQEMVGRTGWDLLSKQALIGLIQLHAPALGLETIPLSDLSLHLNLLLESPNEAIHTIAESIADQYGRRLGYLIASILLSPYGLTSPLTPWEEAYLKHWQEEVKEIILGGGLANGQLGRRIGPAAEGVLVQCGIQDCRIEVSDYPSYLPLIGAARSTRAGLQGPVVVVDFGGTRAKRGLALFNEKHELHRLHALPSHSIDALMGPERASELAAAMITIIADTIKEADPSRPIAPHILCSVAAYVQDGRPMKIDRGAYTRLNHLATDIAGWFSQQISALCQTPVQLEFVHDCDIAACAYAGRPHTAIIMLGSALGTGFTPPDHGYRPVSNHFRLDLA